MTNEGCSWEQTIKKQEEMLFVRGEPMILALQLLDVANVPPGDSVVLISPQA